MDEEGVVRICTVQEVVIFAEQQRNFRAVFVPDCIREVEVHGITVHDKADKVRIADRVHID